MGERDRSVVRAGAGGATDEVVAGNELDSPILLAHSVTRGEKAFNTTRLSKQKSAAPASAALPSSSAAVARPVRLVLPIDVSLLCLPDDVVVAPAASSRVFADRLISRRCS